MNTMCSGGAEFSDPDDQSRRADEAKERLRMDAEILRRAAQELVLQRAKITEGQGASKEVSYASENGGATDESRVPAEDGLSVSSDLSGPSSSPGEITTQLNSKLPLDRGALVTLILNEGSPQRRREIAAELAGSPIIRDAISDLNGAARDKIYLAFSLLFIIAKTGEIQPLLQAIEHHPSLEVRLEVIKLLTLTRDSHVRPAFRDLTLRPSLPLEIQSALSDALDQIPSDQGD